jgi:hypothetical protein
MGGRGCSCGEVVGKKESKALELGDECYLTSKSKNVYLLLWTHPLP